MPLSPWNHQPQTLDTTTNPNRETKSSNSDFGLTWPEIRMRTSANWRSRNILNLNFCDLVSLRGLVESRLGPERLGGNPRANCELIMPIVEDLKFPSFAPMSPRFAREFPLVMTFKSACQALLNSRKSGTTQGPSKPIPGSFFEPLARSWSHFVGIYRQKLSNSSKIDF